MKIRPHNDYVLPGIVLLGASLVLLAVGTLTDRRDMSSATLFLCGVACFLAGIFMLSFSRSEPLDTEVASLLHVAGMLNQCRICADLGVRGDAWFIPPSGREDGIREFIPVQGLEIPDVFPDFSFLTDPRSPGILLAPSALPLLDHLEKKRGLQFPGEETALLLGIREICEDVLEIAERVEIGREGESLVMRVKGYRLYDGCLAVMAQSPKCCTMHPCGICSLVACLLARGFCTPCHIEHVRLEEGQRSIVVVFRSLTAPGPKGGGPGSSG